MTMHVAPKVLIDALDEAGIPYELIRHRRTDTARGEARALSLHPSQVAKTVVLVSPEGFVRVVLPASARLDLRKVRKAIRAGEVRLATEEELSGAYPEFELGAVPPFSLEDRDRVLVDIRLCGIDEVALEAGTHEQSVLLDMSDLLEISEAELVDVCED